jgi:predicted phage tail protein
LLGIGPTPQLSGADTSLVVLNWSADTDQAGLKYSLQISKTPDFTSVAIQKDDIAGASFNLLRSMLPNAGTYYWHVRAVSDAGDIGPWSNNWRFDSSAASPLIIAIAFTVMILVLAIIVFGIIALVSRSRYS